jgi:hypothetical protein
VPVDAAEDLVDGEDGHGRDQADTVGGGPVGQGQFAKAAARGSGNPPFYNVLILENGAADPDKSDTQLWTRYRKQ